MTNFRDIRLIPVVLLLFIAIGCGKKSAVEYENSSTTLKPEGYSVAGSSGQIEKDDDEFSSGDLVSLDQTGSNPLEDDATSEEYRAMYGRSTAPLRPVYFAFDSSAINADQLDHLNESSTYLLENPITNLAIEGNCDERGTADYNLALGESRAISVKKYLANMGVDTGKMTTISFGAQRPLHPGSSETAWAKNRRVDLVIQ